MTKRLVSAAVSVAAIGAAALAMAPSAMATANGGVCQLQGTATFPTPLTAGPAASPFSYTFSGTLSNCHGAQASATQTAVPSGGTIFTPDTVSGTGSCVDSGVPTGIPGTSVIDWNDGKVTVESYSTSGALAAVVVTGSVIASYTAKNGTVYTTNEPSTPVGDGSGGLLTFTPSSPTACQSGVTSAGINGVVGTGNYQ